MRRIVTWALSTLTVLVLLFSYHASSPGAASTTGAATRTQAVAPATGGTGSSGGTSSPGSLGSGSVSGSSTAGSTYAGSVVPTRYGNVQVAITVQDERITAASVLQAPDRDRRDVQINARAVPILVAETVQAQSADIDMVSGATVTSLAYVQSLQAALDKANL